MYEINGTENRMLAIVGAFRVVSESDLREEREDTRRALRHLEREGSAAHVTTQLGRPRRRPHRRRDSKGNEDGPDEGRIDALAEVSDEVTSQSAVERVSALR